MRMTFSSLNTTAATNKMTVMCVMPASPKSSNPPTRLWFVYACQVVISVLRNGWLVMKSVAPMATTHLNYPRVKQYNFTALSSLIWKKPFKRWIKPYWTAWPPVVISTVMSCAFKTPVYRPFTTKCFRMPTPLPTVYCRPPVLITKFGSVMITIKNWLQGGEKLLSQSTANITCLESSKLPLPFRLITMWTSTPMTLALSPLKKTANWRALMSVSVED